MRLTYFWYKSLQLFTSAECTDPYLQALLMSKSVKLLGVVPSMVKLRSMATGWKAPWEPMYTTQKVPSHINGTEATMLITSEALGHVTRVKVWFLPVLGTQVCDSDESWKCVNSADLTTCESHAWKTLQKTQVRAPWLITHPHMLTRVRLCQGGGSACSLFLLCGEPHGASILTASNRDRSSSQEAGNG